MPDKDPTFHDHSAFASHDWVALRLGRSPSWLTKKVSDLRSRHGFPAKVPATDLYLKADVEAWITSQSTIQSNRVTLGGSDTKGANLNAI